MIGVLLLAILTQATPPRDTRPATAAATGAIAGVVTTDELNPRPLRRARVTVNGSGLSSPRTVISGENGAFTIDRLPAGRYTVSAAKEGFITAAYGATRPARPGTPIEVVAAQAQRVSLRLARGAVITGTVLDVDGQPAQGIAVSALFRRFIGGGGAPFDYTYASGGTPAQASTDDRGVYRIYGLPAGDYVVSAQPATVRPGPPGLVGSVVQMMSRGAVNPRPMLMTQMFHPGTADLARATHVIVRAGEERSGIDVQLEYVPLATITGTVNMPPGFSPGRITLWRTDELARFQTGPVTSADAEGRFQFPSIAPGQYRVTARAVPPSENSGTRVNNATTAQYAVADVTVSGEDIELPMSLQPALSIAGRIVFDSDGGAPAGPPLQLRLNLGPMASATGGWPLPPLVIDGTSFRLDGIVPGTYRTIGMSGLQGVRSPIGKWWLRSLVVNGHDILDTPLDFQAGSDDAIATLTDRVSEVSGVVTDARGNPVASTNVVIFTIDRKAWFTGSRRIASARTGATGQYAIRNLPPGEYRATVAVDLEVGEWFDPAVLERLVQSGTPLTIEGPVAKTLHLQHR